MTDAELIRLACGDGSEDSSGDADERSVAWRALSDRYLPLVWRYAHALLGDIHRAEDVVSDTMLAFLRNIHQIDADAPKISAWLRSVVRHKVADHHRRSYRAKDHLPRVAIELQRREGPEDPSTSLVVAEKKKQISEILEGLPERQRLALEMKYVDGMRVKNIAERFGETEKAVEATLYRARREFRRLYELSETEVAGISTSGITSSVESRTTVEFPWQTPSVDS